MCVVPVAYIILEIIWTHAQSLQVIKYQYINVSFLPHFLSSFFLSCLKGNVNFSLDAQSFQLVKSSDGNNLLEIYSLN